MSTIVFQQQQCANCPTLFSPRAVNQVYCSWKCKSRAERKRRKARERGLPGVSPEVTHVDFVVDATNEALGIYAQGFLDNPTLKPKLFRGEFDKTWRAPVGIIFEAQIGVDGWLMANEKFFA